MKLTYASIDGEDDLELITRLQSSFASAGTIELTSTEYSGAGTINLRPGVILKGGGSGREPNYGTRIITEAQTALTMGRAAKVKDVNLHSNSSSANVIHLRGAREAVVEDVWATAKGGTAVFVEGGKGYGCYINKLVRVHTPGCDVGVHIWGTSLEGRLRANHNSLWGCRTDSCDLGILLDECDSTTIFDHHAESCRQAGLRMARRTLRTSILNSYFENRNAIDIDATGASSGGLGWVKVFGGRHIRVIDPNSKVEVI